MELSGKTGEKDGQNCGNRFAKTAKQVAQFVMDDRDINKQQSIKKDIMAKKEIEAEGGNPQSEKLKAPPAVVSARNTRQNHGNGRAGQPY